jgi:hypothetical protein
MVGEVRCGSSSRPSLQMAGLFGVRGNGFGNGKEVAAGQRATKERAWDRCVLASAWRLRPNMGGSPTLLA